MADAANNNAGQSALVLSGGGARAAYQVGVLQAIAEMLPSEHASPFQIICGTSAGAINASGLAVHADNFQQGVQRLHNIWSTLHCRQVFRTDWYGVLDSAFRWLANLSMGWFNRTRPVSLMNNAPLGDLLRSNIELERLPDMTDEGHLRALCITACSYSCGDSVSFFQGNNTLEDWHRARRRGRRTLLSHDHLLASSAIPLVFPAVSLDGEYYGDGALRQLAPISPALHLGAQRLLIIGTGSHSRSNRRDSLGSYPSLAQIIGHIMNSSFIDSLEMDLERMMRINQTVSLLHEAGHGDDSALKPIECLMISPSTNQLEELAARHAHTLPRSIRLFVRGSGMFKRAGSNLLSYLLFEEPYTQALIDLGYQEAKAHAAEIRAFVLPDTPANSAVIHAKRSY